MASSPTYNPALVEGHFAQIARGAQNATVRPPRRSSTARPTALYTPGSTFKVVTAAAALDSGALQGGLDFDDPGYCIEYGKKVSTSPTRAGPRSSAM